MLCRFLSASVILFSLCFSVGCQTARPYAAAVPVDETGVERNAGYALLYATIEEVSDVDRVLLLKRPGDAVSSLLRSIGATARQWKTELRAFADADDSLRYDVHGLPHAEAKARDLIAASTRREVMSSSGRAFEINILLTQYEALNYIAHVAEAVRELNADDDERRAFLERLANDARSLHGEVLELLHTIGEEGER